MDTPKRNPAGIPVPSCFSHITPTEQDVYATAYLFRALANSGDVDNISAFEKCVMQPTQETADLYQNGYIAYRHTG
jgi:hypothetical protein